MPGLTLDSSRYGREGIGQASPPSVPVSWLDLKDNKTRYESIENVPSETVLRSSVG
jgi:hypothetical protein